MKSVPRRFSDASTDLRMCFFDRPLPNEPMSMPTFVAMTTASRLRLLLSHLPITVSDSPPEWPFAQIE